MLGHSTGENTAIIASGLLRSAGADELAGHLRALNHIARDLQDGLPQGTLLTVGALRPARRAALISNPAPLRVAMDNCPNQLVLFGTPEAAETLRRELADEGAVCAELPFGRPYHTELFKPVADAYRSLFRDMQFGPDSARSTAPARPLPSRRMPTASANWRRGNGSVRCASSRPWSGSTRTAIACFWKSAPAPT
jgi:(acyl-carrier-protein) S-malonyltransferase